MSNKHIGKAPVGVTSPERAIFMAAVQLGDEILAQRNKLLTQWGMTALQHNALEVLYVHDTERQGLPSSEIGKYLYTRVPDVTRLLDRLADKGWLIRERDANNRRVVRSRLTDIGIELVESAASSLKAQQEEQLAHLSEADKAELQRLLSLALQT